MNYTLDGVSIHPVTHYKDTGVLPNSLSTGKILEENLIPSAFHQTLKDEFTFQQDNNPKHKAKSTPELFTNMTLNVPEWPNYNLKMAI
uniref:Uncharacterized protein n=1 Tax=Oncorhynchus mykiss TaxID=8022 RepID=A0A8K9XHD7_ONCMY